MSDASGASGVSGANGVNGANVSGETGTDNSNNLGSSGADMNSINLDIQTLYNNLSQKISLIVSGQHFDFQSFEVILGYVIETVQEVHNAGGQQMTDAEKRSVGLSLIKMVLGSLQSSKKITQSTYNSLVEAVDFLGPLLFNAAFDAWAKAHTVEEDIAQHGFKGCFGRNFRTKK